MAATILFISSAVCSLAHLVAMFNCMRLDRIYGIILIRGCVASLINHGTTCEFAKWYDRSVMLDSFFLDLYFMYSTNTLLIAGPWMIAAALTYGMSKSIIAHDGGYASSMLFHLFSHVAITIAHIVVIVSL